MTGMFVVKPSMSLVGMQRKRIIFLDGENTAVRVMGYLLLTTPKALH